MLPAAQGPAQAWDVELALLLLRRARGVPTLYRGAPGDAAWCRGTVEGGRGTTETFGSVYKKAFNYDIASTHFETFRDTLKRVSKHSSGLQNTSRQL